MEKYEVISLMEGKPQHSVLSNMQLNSILTTGSSEASKTGHSKMKFFRSTFLFFGFVFPPSPLLPRPLVSLSPYPQCFDVSLCYLCWVSQHPLLYYVSIFQVNPVWIFCCILTMILLTAVPAVGILLDSAVGHRIRNELKFWFLAFERMSTSLSAGWDGSISEVCGFLSFCVFNFSRWNMWYVMQCSFQSLRFHLEVFFCCTAGRVVWRI